MEWFTLENVQASYTDRVVILKFPSMKKVLFNIRNLSVFISHPHIK